MASLAWPSRKKQRHPGQKFCKQGHKNASHHRIEDINMPTTTNAAGIAILNRSKDDKKVKQDMNVIQGYVKEELFTRAIFVWDEKELEIGKRLHQDFLANCKPKLAGGDLMTGPEEAVTCYLSHLWVAMREKKKYREWLAVKRPM